LVIKIHQTESTTEAFNYNEKKVEQKQARFFHSKNTTELTPFVYSKAQRLAQLIDIESRNKRCKNKCFHVSVNPTNAELEKLTKNGLKKEIEALMKQMGYGQQPYFVYEHADLKRTHFHILSTRIDAQSGKKISDSNEKRKVSQFIIELQQRYEFVKAPDKPDKVQLIPTIDSTNLHKGIQQVFKLLNKSNVSNQQEYCDIIKTFNLEIYQSERWQSVMVKNQEGTILRHPIALSQFDEQPDLLTCQSQGTNEKVQQELKQKTEQILKELNLSYRFYNIKDLREAFIKHNLLPYSLSKNGNLNIYSPMDKTVVDAQYLLKKNKMRLQTFTLSNDQFYDIIRDLTNQFRQGKHSFIESIVDKEKSALEDSETRKIVLKELNLEGCGAYSTIASKLDSKEQETVKKGIKSHLEYIANKVFDKARFTSESYKNVKGRSLWGKVNHQFLIELLKYPHWDNTKNVNRRRLSYNKRRKGRRFSF
jgi:hypothetical protein